MKAYVPAILAGVVLSVLAGCGRKAAETDPVAAQLHRSVAPHGGTPVALGDDYRLELVRDAAAGTLSAYVLDDEMEEFIRVPARSLTIVARAGGEDRPLVLTAVANPATGETVGSTSLFQAQADWLKTTGKFEGTLEGLTVRGTPFAGVHFHFPAAE